MDGCDVDNHRIGEIVQWQNIIYIAAAGIKSELIYYLYAWEAHERSLLHKHVETNRRLGRGTEFVPIGIPIVCWKPRAPNRINML